MTSPVTARPNQPIETLHQNIDKPTVARATDQELEQAFDNLFKELHQNIPGEIPPDSLPNTKQNPDFTSAERNFEVKNKSSLHGIPGIKFFEKFLTDTWPIRKMSALGNETAESFKHMIFEYLPAPIAYPVFIALWALAFLSTGARVVANAAHDKDGRTIKAGVKMGIHDGLAAIGLPTAWIRLIADPIQKKLYQTLKIPKKLADLLRSAGSIISSYFVIGALDNPVRAATVKLLNMPDDHHASKNGH